MAESVGAMIGGAAGVLGLGVAAVKRAKQIGEARAAWIELREAISHVQQLAERYNAAQADGTITLDEAKDILYHVQKTVRECIEAKDAMDRVLK
jgi:hypothetical protein